MNPTLVLFALPEEAAPFQRLAGGLPGIQTRVTGMGRKNSEAALIAALAETSFARVLTCGYAGALNPALRAGDVLFDCDELPALRAAFLAAGALEARFHCHTRIAATAAEKRSLRSACEADAVEMESGVVRQLCRHRDIPSATLRAVSDTAGEDLPLDFNRLVTPACRLHAGRLAAAILRRPTCVSGLLRLRRQSRLAARELARVLAQALALG